MQHIDGDACASFDDELSLNSIWLHRTNIKGKVQLTCLIKALFTSIQQHYL